MSTLLITIVSLVGALIVLMAVPIDIELYVERNARVEGRVNFRWLFGLVKFAFDLPPEARAQQPEPGEREPGKRKHRKIKRGRDGGNLLGVFRQPAFRRRVWRFVKDLVRAAHSRDVFLHMRIGLGDPADTGRLWGFVGPLAMLASSRHGADITIEPEFMDPVFEFRGHGCFRFVPLEFLLLAIAFLLSPPSLRAWRTLRQGSG